MSLGDAARRGDTSRRGNLLSAKLQQIEFRVRQHGEQQYVMLARESWFAFALAGGLQAGRARFTIGARVLEPAGSLCSADRSHPPPPPYDKTYYHPLGCCPCFAGVSAYVAFTGVFVLVCFSFFFPPVSRRTLPAETRTRSKVAIDSRAGRVSSASLHLDIDRFERVPVKYLDNERGMAFFEVSGEELVTETRSLECVKYRN